MKDNYIITRTSLSMQGLWIIGLFSVIGAVLNMATIPLFGDIVDMEKTVQVVVSLLIGLPLFIVTGLKHPNGTVWSVTCSIVAACSISSGLIALAGILMLAVSRFSDHKAWVALIAGTIVCLSARSIMKKRGVWAKD